MTLLPTAPRPARPSSGAPRKLQLPPGALALGGACATAIVVVAGGRVGPIRGTARLSGWWGLVAAHGVNPLRHPLPGLVLVGGVALLILVWLLTVRALRDARMTLRKVWLLAACWALPLILGPPLLSGDVLTFAAQGFLVASHLDPYRVGPAALGGLPAAIVDPRWRGAPSPYGPLATALQWASVEVGGTALGAVVFLKSVATLSVVVIGLLASRLAPAGRRPAAVVLTVLNPVVLLQVVSAGHLEGLMVALVLGAFLLYRRGHPYLALLAAVAAADIKAPALAAVGVLLVSVVVDSPRARRLGVALRAAATSVLSLGLIGFAIPYGWGWVRTVITTPAQGYTPAAPTSWLDIGLSPPLVLTHLVSSATLLAACRDLGLLGAAGIGCTLVLTIRRRPPLVTAGLGMLAIGLLGPVYYPWYGLWGSECLLPGAAGRQRDWLVMLTAVSAIMSVPGLSTLTVWVIGTLVAVAALTWAVRDLIRRGLPGRPRLALDAGVPTSLPG